MTDDLIDINRKEIMIKGKLFFLIIIKHRSHYNSVSAYRKTPLKKFCLFPSCILSTVPDYFYMLFIFNNNLSAGVLLKYNINIWTSNKAPAFFKRLFKRPLKS